MKKSIIICLLFFSASAWARRFYITNNLGDEQEAEVTISKTEDPGSPILYGPITIADGETHTFNIIDAQAHDSEVYHAIIEWDDEENTEPITVTQDNDFYIDEHGDIEEEEYPEGPIQAAQ